MDEANLVASKPAPFVDPLLEELNGALARSGEPQAVPGDPALIQPPSLESQLETSTKPAPAPRALQLDKTYSKAAGGRGYRVVVSGDYYAASTETKGHILKKYSLPFNLPALSNAKGESALGIIVGKSRPGGGMLNAALAKFDPLSKGAHTHEISQVTPLEGAPEPTSLAYMSFDALKKFAAESAIPEGFPIDPELYWDVNHLREDLIDFRTNQTSEITEPTGEKTKGGIGLKKTSVGRIHERFANRLEEKELAEMNSF